MNTELIALPVFQERISPLMDVSDRYAIFEASEGTVRHKIDISLNAESELQRVEKLKEIGVNTIICGAVSGCIARVIDEKGIRLISMVYGPVEEIITHYLAGSLATYCPGPAACGKRRGGRRKRCDVSEEKIMRLKMNERPKAEEK